MNISAEVSPLNRFLSLSFSLSLFRFNVPILLTFALGYFIRTSFPFLDPEIWIQEWEKRRREEEESDDGVSSASTSVHILSIVFISSRFRHFQIQSLFQSSGTSKSPFLVNDPSTDGNYAAGNDPSTDSDYAAGNDPSTDSDYAVERTVILLLNGR